MTGCVLVAGGDRVDAGKTTFATGLVGRMDAPGFKPRAGNDYWFDHDDVVRATRDGRLYGKDARRLAGASPDRGSPEQINRIHRLWHPDPTGGSGLVGAENRRFLLDRVGDRFVVNGTATLPDPLRERLPLGTARTVRSVADLDAATADLHLSALESLAGTIAAEPAAVVESYGDVARPVRGIDVDAVAVVSPARVAIYDGPRFEKACRLTTGDPGTGTLEERVPSVTDLVDPVDRVDLPPLGSEERTDPDAVARAYEPAFDAVLACAASDSN